MKGWLSKFYLKSVRFLDPIAAQSRESWRELTQAPAVSGAQKTLNKRYPDHCSSSLLQVTGGYLIHLFRFAQPNTLLECCRC